MPPMTSTPRAGSRSWLFFAGLLGLAVGAAVVGGYLDWLWWHPTQGIVITLAAIGLLVLTGVLAVVRNRITRSAAMVALALGVGLLIGQLVGPARELPQVSSGTMTLTLDGPIQAEATGRADCSTVSTGDQLQVGQDVNTRLPLPDQPSERYPLVSASFKSGDMWAPEFGRRPDELVVTIYLNSAVEVADAPTELWLRSTPSSTLVAEMSGNDGSVTFSGLELTEGDLQSMLGASGDVAGTLAWICD